MNREPKTPTEEFEFYRLTANQTPQGPPRRRRPPLSDPVPVRFPQHMLEQIRARAEAEDRSVSAWVRRAVERALRVEAS